MGMIKKLIKKEKSAGSITPADYFDIVKGKVHTIDDDGLLVYFDNCIKLIEKYQVTGQEAPIKKLLFHMECIEKERVLVKSGVNKFIYRDDIEEYIEKVADKAVKIIELSRYEREIPDEYVGLVKFAKTVFSEIYILFTDYTGKEEKRIKKEKIVKDPIMFGVFNDTKTYAVVDRFYYLCDWVDEYCDLTLDKFVSEMKNKKGIDVLRKIDTPKAIEEIRKQLEELDKTDGGIYKMKSSWIQDKVNS